MGAKADHLYKRGNVYYFRAKIRGKLHCQSLGPIAVDDARKIARELYRKAHTEEIHAIMDGLKVRDTFSSIGDLCARYLTEIKLMGRVKEKTAKGNVTQLRYVIGAALDLETKAEIYAQSCGVLDEDLVSTFVKAMLEDAEDENRTRRTINSILRQARSVIKKDMMAKFKGLRLPDLNGFRDADAGEDPKKRYRLPPKELRASTHEAAAKLRETDPAKYMVYLLCYHVGMRAKEAASARWDWFEEKDNGRVFVHIIERADFSPKGYDGIIPVPMHVWLEMKAMRNNAIPHLVQGDTQFLRERFIGRDFAQWMRGIGWDATTYPKAAHELRKLIGSQWYKAFTADGARERLRHANIQTTLDYYAHLDYEDLEALEKVG